MEELDNERPETGAPTVDLQSGVYSRKRGRLMELVNVLMSSGASLELDVPRIAVIGKGILCGWKGSQLHYVGPGNQSAGKSSLIEAISRISVPRDAGTCTRCPMEVRFKSSSSPWTCRISLRLEVDVKGAKLADVKEVSFGPTLVNPSLVEPMLRKAQLAILFPHTDPSWFVKLSPESVQRINKDDLPPGRKAASLVLEEPCVHRDL